MKNMLHSWSLRILLVAGMIAVALQTAAPIYAASATLSLSPASQSVTAGQAFDIAITLNSGGAQIAATDVDLTFNQSKLVLVDIISGTIFDQYVGKSINNSSGKASITGLPTSAEKLFTGTGTFATLRFQATNAGAADVSFDFTSGNRNDSNVAEYGNNTDILSSVTNGSYTITGTSSSTTTTTTSTSTGASTGTSTNTTAPTATPRRVTSSTTLPVTASPMPTVILTFTGIFLAWLGILTGKTT